MEVELKHTDESIVEQEAHQVCRIFCAQHYRAIHQLFLGPARPPVHMIQKNPFSQKYISKTDTLETRAHCMQSVNFSRHIALH